MLFWKSSVGIHWPKSRATIKAISNKCAISERALDSMAPKLILTGFMATGKSAVARAIARWPAWRLIDCDDRIAARTGSSIAEIFRAHGEARFRAIERDLIAEIAAERRRCPQCANPLPAVVATGGGAILDDENFAALASCGIVVCLRA